MSERQKIFDKADTKMKFDSFCKEFFWHPVGDALRLSNTGLTYLKECIPYFEVEVLDKNNIKSMPGKHFIYLARFCRKPYYIGVREIVFFDEEEAFIFKLCDGDIENVREIAPEKLK